MINTLKNQINCSATIPSGHTLFVKWRWLVRTGHETLRQQGRSLAAHRVTSLDLETAGTCSRHLGQALPPANQLGRSPWDGYSGLPPAERDCLARPRPDDWQRANDWAVDRQQLGATGSNWTNDVWLSTPGLPAFSKAGAAATWRRCRAKAYWSCVLWVPSWPGKLPLDGCLL